MNKRIISVIISVILILSSLSISVIASDYSGHWCEAIINELMNDNVITGDGAGVRPNDNIKRSEFVTIINKAFGFPNDGTVNFPDVSSDKWYFNQFLIAKSAGYLTGDQNGNANPENNITRVEASAILVRALKLNPKETAKFTDDALIPEWGKEYVYTLYSNGIIKGYPDGSFGAANAITRAESFSLIHSSKYNGTSNDVSNVENNKTSTEVKTTGGGGGGGGSWNSGNSGSGNTSGGASSTEFEITRKIENTPDDNGKYNVSALVDESLTWTNFSENYNITLERKTENQTVKSLNVQVNANSANIKELVKQVLSNPEERVPFEVFEVKVSCVKDSVTYQAAETINIVFPHISQPEVKVVSEINAGVEKLFIVWENDANASTYELKADLDSNGLAVVSHTLDGNINKAEISAELFKNLPEDIAFTLNTESSDKAVALNMPELTSVAKVPLYASGEGSVAKPYIIKTARHFQNIEKESNSNFYVAEEITLDKEDSQFPFTTIESFGGSISGYNEATNKEEKVTINLNSEDGMGLFGKASKDGVSIRNLKISGSITGTATYCSAILGTAGFVTEFINCENNATFNVTGVKVGATEPYTGGLFAYTTANVTFESCVNTGNITSNGASRVGGLLGFSNGGAVTATNCGNKAVVKNSSGYAGGIGGEFRNSAISKCYNIGEVTAYRYAGGIIANNGVNGARINECYNSGTINTTADDGNAYSGGIVSNLTYTATLANSFNTGKIESVSGKCGGVVGYINDIADYIVTISECYSAPDEIGNFYGAAAGEYSISNCYNLGVNSNELETGLKNITSDDLKTLSNLSGFKTSEWHITGKYLYPQLVNNPYIITPKTLKQPGVSVVPSRTSYILKIENGDANTEKYTVGIYNDSALTDLVEEFELPGGSYASIDIINKLPAYSTYYVKIVAEGDDEVYLDAESVTISFAKTLFTFLPVIGKVSGNAADEYTVNWTVNETEGLSNYLITVTDKESGTDILTDESVTADKLSYTITDSDFVPGKEYTFKIKAVGTNTDESSDFVSKDFTTLYAEGNGNETTPFVIRNERHFKNIPTGTTAYFWLAEDISLDQTSTTGAYIPGATFSGKLIGMKSDLSAEEIRTVNINATYGKGLFTQVNAATVKNLKFTGSFTVENTTNDYIGLVAGESQGSTTISNCHNEVAIDSGNTYVGAIIGYSNNGTVTFNNCSNKAAITGGTWTGGIGGGIKRSIVTNCSNTGNISGYRHASGIVGVYNKGSATVSKSYNTGDISNRAGSGARNAGGIIGFVDRGTASVTDCYNTGTVTSNDPTYAGKIVGNAVGTTITNCYDSTLNTTAMANGTVTYSNCYYRANATGTASNGLQALSDSDMQIKDNFVGFDFADIWNEPDASATYKYPTLK